MLWMLVTVHKSCHVPHTPRITTWGTIFIKNFFSVSKEWIRSWSQAFLITNIKTLAKKLFDSRSIKSDEKRKKEKLEWKLQSFLRFTQTQKMYEFGFALNSTWLKVYGWFGFLNNTRLLLGRKEIYKLHYILVTSKLLLRSHKLLIEMICSF